MELLLFSIWLAAMAIVGLFVYRAQHSLKKYRKTHQA